MTSVAIKNTAYINDQYHSMIDNRYTIQTPEGVELPIHVAGAPARALARVLDSIIIGIAYLCIFIFVSFITPGGITSLIYNGVSIGIILICIFLINWLYDIVFEVWLNGTPGKRALNLKVIHTNGTPVSLKASFIRNVLRAVDILPFGYSLGLVTMCLSKRFQRLGDILADTVVIYKEQALLGSPIANVASIPIPSHLSYDDRQTILLFAERYSTLAPQRRLELAEKLAFLVPPNEKNPIPTLLGYANWLIRG